MQTIKTSKLTGAALDWAVAKCENQPVLFDGERMRYLPGQFSEEEPFDPSINWSQGGPIIEREGISTRHSEKDARGAWYAVLGPNRFLSPDHEGSGPTPLIAAMRCYVASKLGDTVEVPNELAV